MLKLRIQVLLATRISWNSYMLLGSNGQGYYNWNTHLGWIYCF
uniref:Uncharacterized protein n=1 Tax=Rhizophora mucronata TaxID=61149 RepID=A0A2P2PL29_RHIMU